MMGKIKKDFKKKSMDKDLQEILDHLTNNEKSILFSIGDKPRDKYFGLDSTVPNYLTSLKLVNYCGGGRYELSDEGRKLYLHNIKELDRTKTTNKQQLLIN